MMKRNRTVYIAAAACIAAGTVLTAGGALAGGKPGISIGSDGIRLLGDGETSYTLEKTKLEAFSSAEISLDYGDFYLIPSDGYYLEYCLSGQGEEPEYEVKDETLVFTENPKVTYMQFAFMDFSDSAGQKKNCVKLYVPEEVYFDRFSLQSGSGDGKIEGLKSKSTEIRLDYGNLTAGCLEGETISIELGSGDMKTETAAAQQKLSVCLDYGDLNAQTLQAAEISIQNGSGNVKAKEIKAEKEGTVRLDYGTLEAESVKAGSLYVQSGSGDVKLESLLIEKNADLSLDYGNAVIGIGNEISGYTLELDTDYGSIQAPKAGMLTKESSAESFRLEGSQEKEIKIFCGSGDITVK